MNPNEESLRKFFLELPVLNYGFTARVEKQNKTREREREARTGGKLHKPDLTYDGAIMWLNQSTFFLRPRTCFLLS
jgi:hypothetical protein